MHLTGISVDVGHSFLIPLQFLSEKILMRSKVQWLLDKEVYVWIKIGVFCMNDIEIYERF